ncbi:roundabout homolog 3-like [Procambarus clarkii]|uniref:roundabout homolog 3-like n=1 Tax=Procambarus clarkii TaxID=6728 RepID=UPI0037436C4B
MPPQSVGVQLTNVTTASIFWSPPPPLHRNGPITGYQLEVVSADGAVFLSQAVNGSVRALRVHNLTLGNSYHLTLAASTAAGRGPYTSPVSLHVDPVLLHPLAKSGPSLAALDGDVWVIGLIGAAVFCLLLVSVATLLLWRRHARNKALGHVGGKCLVLFRLWCRTTLPQIFLGGWAENNRKQPKHLMEFETGLQRERLFLLASQLLFVSVCGGCSRAGVSLVASWVMTGAAYSRGILYSADEEVRLSGSGVLSESGSGVERLDASDVAVHNVGDSAGLHVGAPVVGCPRGGRRR